MKSKNRSAELRVFKADSQLTYADLQELGMQPSKLLFSGIWSQVNATVLCSQTTQFS